MPGGSAAAIYYAVSGTAGRKEVVGLDVAVDGFLHAFFRYARRTRFLCHAVDEAAFAAFRDRLVAAGGDPAQAELVPISQAARLAEGGCLFCPDANIAAFADARHGVGARAYSLCGVSHTLSTASAMRAVIGCLTQPTQPWDAIVCPSRAIRSAIQALWSTAIEHLGDAAGPIACPVQLPVIPLGVDCDAFAARTTAERRRTQRDRLGVSDDAVVVLFHGRISYHSKAHPLPLLLAAERAARHSGRSLHLVFYGYFPAPRFAEDFRQAAADVCKTARVAFIDNQDSAFPEGLWAAADVFVSLSDNIQESFGLTPVEAMASGVPALVSDWDGYRDTVRDGEEGFLVPTLAPPPGAGAALADRFATGVDEYGRYLAAASQATAVDPEAAAVALERLVGDAGLRRRMGESGRRRARAVYDWRNVIPAYEELWSELGRRRARAAEAEARPQGIAIEALRPDPFRVFAAFPSRHLAEADRLELVPDSVRELTRRLAHRMNMFAPDTLLAPERLPRLLGAVGAKPGVAVGEILAGLAAEDEPSLLRTIVWLTKLGILRCRAGVGPTGCDLKRYRSGCGYLKR